MIRTERIERRGGDGAGNYQIVRLVLLAGDMAVFRRKDAGTDETYRCSPAIIRDIRRMGLVGLDHTAYLLAVRNGEIVENSQKQRGKGKISAIDGNAGRSSRCKQITSQKRGKA